MIPPLILRWDGDCFLPAKRFKALCDKHLVVGEHYRMVEEPDRSKASHDHYFAAIEDAWQNVPENLSDLYPTSEHLRKRALIAAGYCDQRSLVCSSHAEALRACAFMRGLIDYSLCDIEGTTVTIYTPQSQSKRAMGAKRFQESKESVLAIISELVGVDVDNLKRNAGQAA